MGSNSRDIREILGLAPQEGHNYPVLVFSVIGNFVLLVQWLPDGGLSKPFIALLAILVCVPPTVMGYTDQPFYSGIGVGILPMLVFAVVDHWHPPLTVNEIQNIINGSVFWAGMALPVATFLFAVGVLIQTRSLRGERVRTLVLQALFTIALSVIILLVKLTTNLFASGELH